MVDAVKDLVKSVNNINDVLTVAAENDELKEAFKDISDDTTALADAATSVETEVDKVQVQIDDAIDQGGGYALIAAGVMFGITFVIMIAAVIGRTVQVDPG